VFELPLPDELPVPSYEPTPEPAAANASEREPEPQAEPDPRPQAAPRQEPLLEPVPALEPAPAADAPPPAAEPAPPARDVPASLDAPAVAVLAAVPGTNVPPDYPRDARRAGHEGVVVVRFRCDAAGAVTHAEIVRSSGHARLDASALAAVRRWRFANGPGEGEQPFVFRLRG
jgi:protein TonB